MYFSSRSMTNVNMIFKSQEFGETQEMLLQCNDEASINSTENQYREY